MNTTHFLSMSSLPLAIVLVGCGGELVSSGSGGGGAAGASGATTSVGTGSASKSSSSTSTGSSATSASGSASNSVSSSSSSSSGGGLGPAPVNLGTASAFVVLAKSGITTIPPSVLTGNIGVSPIDSTAITGFSLTLDLGGTFATSSQVVGKVYASDYTSPTPANLTVAIGDIEAAYTDAAARPLPDFVNVGAGAIGGLTLAPGLYKWGTGVSLDTDPTFAGGPNDVWILQIGGGITEASNVAVHLSGGALAKNIFWQSAGAVALGTGSHIEGVILSQTEITLATGASANGRMLSQTAVTLDGATVTEPAP